MRILGVDPGLAVTGYGIIDLADAGKIKIVEAGVVRTSPKSNIAARLVNIYNNFKDIIKENKPDVVVLEKLYSHYKHPTTSILMSHARSVICLLSGLHDIKLVNYPSTRIKKAVTGNGHASKIQVQKMITERLHLKRAPESVDVTDALALAFSFVYIELRGLI